MAPNPYYLLHKKWNKTGTATPLEIFENNNKQEALSYIWHYREKTDDFDTVVRYNTISLAEIIQKVLNINTNDSYATLAKILQLSFENFYAHKSFNDPSLINYKDNIYDITPNNIDKFNLLISKNIFNYNGKKLSKFYSYRIANKYITLSASIKDNSVFVFGHTPPYATFYNFTLIDKNPNFSILFFQNINQAFAYENILSKNNLTIPNSVITGHNSNDLGILDWSLHTERKLLFICETKKKAYEELGCVSKLF